MDDENSTPDEETRDDGGDVQPETPEEASAGGGDGDGDGAAEEQRTDDINARLTALESIVSRMSKTLAEMQEGARAQLMDGDDADDAEDDDEDVDGAHDDGDDGDGEEEPRRQPRRRRRRGNDDDHDSVGTA